MTHLRRHLIVLWHRQRPAWLVRLRWYWLVNTVRGYWWRATDRCPYHKFFAIVDGPGPDGYLYHACLMCGARLTLDHNAPSPIDQEGEH